jgi:hypothetical protein
VKRCRIDSSQTQIQLFHDLSRTETLKKDTLTKQITECTNLSYQDFFLFKENEPSGSLRLCSTEHPLSTLCDSTFQVYFSKAVEKLQRLIQENKHKNNTDSPLKAVYVGAIDASKVFLQENNALLLVNLSKLLEGIIFFFLKKNAVKFQFFFRGSLSKHYLSFRSLAHYHIASSHTIPLYFFCSTFM